MTDLEAVNMFPYYFLISDRSALTRYPNVTICVYQKMLPGDFSPGGATTEEFLAKARPGILTCPGIKYPVREIPHSDI